MRPTLWFVRSLCAIVLVIGAGMPAARATPLLASDHGLATADSSWHWQNPLPHGNSLAAVACPDQTNCFAVGSGTIMVSHDGGRSWAVSIVPADGMIGALACPDARTCYAIANTGPNASTIIGTKDGGVTWSPLWQGNRGFDHISCPQTGVCYVIGTYVQAILSTRDGGTSWALKTPSFQPVAIACPGADVCYAPLASNLITSPPPSVVVTTDGGSHWMVRPVGVGKGDAQLAALACPTPSICVVVAYGGGSDQYRAFAVVTKDGGVTWQRQAFPPNSFDRGASIACPTAVSCSLVGDKGAPSGVIVTTSDGGHTFTRKNALPFVPTAITCSVAQRCIVAGNGGALLRTDTGWSTRILESHNAAVGSIPHLVPALQSVACPSTRICYAGGEYGAMVKTTTAGSRWFSLPSPRNSRLRGAPIGALACPSTIVCYAGSYQTFPARARVISTRDGGRTWSDKPGAGLAVVACPAQRLCYAGGLRGEVQVTHDSGRTWRHLRTPLSGKPYDIQHLVCPTSLICYATAMGPSEPPPHPSSNVGAILSTYDGGRTWHRTLTDPYPLSLACRTPLECLTLLAGYHPNGTVPALVTHRGSTAWSKITTLPPGYWSAATCVNRSTCTLVGASGSVAVTRNGLQTWQQEMTPTFNNLEAIRCVNPTVCYTVGQFSTILQGR